MKIAYIFRQGAEADFILNSVEIKKTDLVIIETGELAKKKKLKRILKRSYIYKLPFIFLNLTTLYIYAWFVEDYYRKNIPKRKQIHFKSDFVIDDVNEEKCINKLTKYNPDIIIVYGVGIIKSAFISNVNCEIFNIHSGILPKYRNVHSDYWAYINSDFKNIGVTIIYLDEGIDSGDIAIQHNIKVSKSDSLFSIKYKLLKEIPDLISILIKSRRNEKLSRIKQDKNKKGFYPTPNFIDLLKITLK